MSEGWDELLRCPRDRGPLTVQEDRLACADGHTYPIAGGIPVLLVPDAEPTEPAYWTDPDAIGVEETSGLNDAGIDRYVEQIVAGTCGNLYRPLIGKLGAYPIPELRLPAGGGRTLLDIGCNWGRWSIAGARAGYAVVGVDPSLDAVRAARRVARQLGVDVRYVVADARRLPFPDASFDVVFSYSVLQHLARPEARRAIHELGRVVTPGGQALVQMANAFGLRNLCLQARRGFRDPGGFGVRYWTPRTLRRAFASAVGPPSVSADGFFSLNPQASDLSLLPARQRVVIRTSDGLRRLSTRLSLLRYIADSVYVTAVRPKGMAGTADIQTHMDWIS